MSKRWSKLQARLYKIMDPEIDFQIHVSIYEMNSNNGYHGNKLPRYFITIGKDSVFDYPKDFDTSWEYGFNTYPWITDIGAISDMIDAYIERPEEKLMEPFDQDRWGITDILRICDRRLGKRRLKILLEETQDKRLIGIIKKRLE